MLLENHDLSLVVDGRQFGGWLDVRLSRGIERAADDFQIGVTQRWPGRDKRFEIPKGVACEVGIGDGRSAAMARRPRSRFQVAVRPAT